MTIHMSGMDLNAEIIRQMADTPAEVADRTINNVLGAQYTFVSKPHLNPTPDEQVAMQQVRKAPAYDAQVREVARRQTIPNRTWKHMNYLLVHENGRFEFISLTSRSFLGFSLADKETVLHTVAGKNGVERMIGYIDNSPDIPSECKTYFTDSLAASAGIRLGKEISEARVSGTFVNPIRNGSDYLAQATPTGMVSEGFFGTGYDWGNTIAELPDF
jgi:hypothetical protein